MLKIEYYKDESKALSGYYSCCAYVDTNDFYGCTNLDQLEVRCKTYEEARDELLKRIISLRDGLNDLIEKEW